MKVHLVEVVLVGGARLHRPVRESFLGAIEEEERELERQSELAAGLGSSIMELDARTIRRHAITRALIAHGFLNVRRRRVSLPIRSICRAKIS